MSNSLFSAGGLREVLDSQLRLVPDVVAKWDEDLFLATPDPDIVDLVMRELAIEPPVLQRDGITAATREQDVPAREFGEDIQVRQRVVTFVVPFSGLKDIFNFRPDRFTHSPPRGEVRGPELWITWTGPPNLPGEQIRRSLENSLMEIDRWLDQCKVQIDAYNELVAEHACKEVRARKTALLATREIEASLGFPIRRRQDAGTYAVPIVRKQFVPVRVTPAAGTYRPEPALDDDHYEAALAVLKSQRNQMERSPTTIAHFGEEQIRDNLLIGLNAQFEGRAAGEVFNGKGKTDILVREGDKHVFIGECKIWKGPKTITDTLNQLLGYLVWRDTKAALLLFIRTGSPSEIIEKAVTKVREHPNYKRDGRNATEERYDFILHATGDLSREIKLAFLPFVLPKTDLRD
ncbi:hypothetical protein ABTX85_37405 [Streptomyces sp. NPDC096097]|uniref:hypothetical protein n=1 Tax=Streptomyces sp. NPDC096097 TaxID=3155546 RepID=UPI0033276E2C